MGSTESKYSNFRLLKFGALNCGPCIALAEFADRWHEDSG